LGRKRSLFFISVAVAELSLAVCFTLNDRLWLATATLLPLAGMLFAYRPAFHRLAHFSLAGFTGLSAAGVLFDLPLLPLVLAPTAALASWDLVLEMHDGSPATELYERAHLQYLSAALGVGLSGVGILVWIHLRLAFIAMLALGVILLVCLNWLVMYIQRNAKVPH